MLYFAQLVATHHASHAGPPVNVGNVISDVATVLAAVAALVTVIVAFKALGVAQKTLFASNQANRDAATERQAAERERIAAAGDRKDEREERQRDREAAQTDRSQTRADRQLDRRIAQLARDRGRLERIATVIEDLDRAAWLSEPPVSDVSWKLHRRTLGLLMAGLTGRFPSIDAILDGAMTVTAGQITSACFTARRELQAEIDRLAAEETAADGATS